MGVRFRKRIKIAPGLTLNLNKKSIGLTAGVKGAHVSINTKGQRTTSVGIPGTGLSYVDIKNTKNKTKSKSTSTYNTKKQYDFNSKKEESARILREKYSINTIKRFSLFFYITGGFMSFAGLLLCAATFLGIMFLLLGIYLIYLGRFYSKAVKWECLLDSTVEIKPIIAEAIKEKENIPSSADEIRKFKVLLDDGIISEQEFEEKKKQLLGL